MKIEELDQAISSLWMEMASWPPAARRENLPPLLSKLRRAESRLMVLRQAVLGEIAVWSELVEPKRAEVMADFTPVWTDTFLEGNTDEEGGD